MPRCGSCLAGIAIVVLAPAAVAGPVAWGGWGGGPGEFRSPLGVAVHHDRIFVADFDNDRIQVLSEDGAALFSWGVRGSGPGEFRGPSGLAIDASGTVHVADHYNGRIQRFGSDGRFLGAWSLGPGRRPFAVAADPGGGLLVSEFDAGRVSRWSAEGALLAEWHDLGNPWGVAADAAGHYWVADHSGDRVLRWTGSGSSWEVVSPSGGLRGPMALVMDVQGRALVTTLSGLRVVEGPSTELSDGEAGERLAGIAARGADLFAVDMIGHHLVALTAPGHSAGVERLQLSTPHPSPASGPVTFRFALPGPRRLALTVFGVDGRQIWSWRGELPGGTHQIPWGIVDAAGRPAPAGLYFARLRTEGGVAQETRTARIVVAR